MLHNAGYDPVVKPASINETLPFDMKPETATMYLAMSKAFAVADEITPISDDGLTVHDPVRFSVNRDWPPAGEDIRIIARAANKMSPEQRQKMMAILRDSFSEAFRNTESDDLDDNGDGYLDERV